MDNRRLGQAGGGGRLGGGGSISLSSSHSSSGHISSERTHGAKGGSRSKAEDGALDTGGGRGGNRRVPALGALWEASGLSASCSMRSTSASSKSERELSYRSAVRLTSAVSIFSWLANARASSVATSTARSSSDHTDAHSRGGSRSRSAVTAPSPARGVVSRPSGERMGAAVTYGAVVPGVLPLPGAPGCRGGVSGAATGMAAGVSGCSAPPTEGRAEGTAEAAMRGAGR